MAQHLEHWASNSADYQRGCLLGGAVGDALGAPLQFFSRDDILLQYGDDGLLDYAPIYGRTGAITDDTQLAMFTAEGLLRYRVASANGEQPHVLNFVHCADLRWLATQSSTTPATQERSFLLSERGMYARRAARDSFAAALSRYSKIGESVAENRSQFGVGLCRIAPLALHLVSDERKFWGEAVRTEMFALSVNVCALSDGHPNGKMAGGVLGLLLLGLLYGHSPEACLARIEEQLRQEYDSDRLRRVIDRVRELANSEPCSPAAIESLAGDSMALDLLSVALYCLLCAEDFSSALRLAINHSGLSDSCGALTGQLLGARRGCSDIPQHFLRGLEHRELLDCLAADFLKSPEEPLMKQRYGA